MGSGDEIESATRQSRTQSLQAFLSAVGRLERLYDNGTSLNIFEFFDWLLFCNQPIKKSHEYSKKFHDPKGSPGD